MQLFKEACPTYDSGSLRLRSCHSKTCVVCTRIDSPRPIILQGLCALQVEEFNIDTEYYPSGAKNGRVYFRYSCQTNIFCKINCRGLQSSSLYFKAEETNGGKSGQWIIKSLRDESYELRLSRKDSQHYPFGSYNWKLGSLKLKFIVCILTNF